MSGYAHPCNTSVMHASGNIESVRPLSGDERRATWAAKYYARGLHRGNGKPRIRVTVPQPLTDQCQPAPDHRTTPPPGATAQVGIPYRPALTSHCELDQPKQRGAVSDTPAIDDETGWDEYIRGAMAGEFQPF